MLSQKELKKALEQWKQHCSEIQSITTAGNASESKTEQLRRIQRARKDYAYFVEYYFPHYCTDKDTGKLIPSAKFHIKAANEILNNKTLKAVYMWARGHAKSTHIDIFIPMWLKCQEKRQINTMVLVGKSEANAIQLLGDLQAELQFNKRYIRDFGEQYSTGQWTDGEFITTDGCSFNALGRGQSPRGLRERENRPDYIVIDDLDDDELVENDSRVRKVTDWVKTALFGCFGAEGGRFIMVGNLISKNSVLANISKIQNVSVSQINVLDKNGQPSWPEYWTKERVTEKQLFMGYRPFQKEYMNNPITEGAVFHNDWMRWKKAYPLRQYDYLVAYCDPSFKPTTKNDYKAIKLWGKKGNELHLLKAFVRQCSVAEMVRWFYDLHESLPENVICEYYIEANFLQDTLLDEFTNEGNARGYQLPIRGDKRNKPDKYQRIEAVSPLWERGFVYYNENLKNDPDMTVGIEQTLAFQKGSNVHDDGPDADEGAIFILQKRSRVEGFEPRIGRRTTPKNNW